MSMEKTLKAIQTALADKGKRNFTQALELIINFKGIDFNKQENRLNLEIALPKGRGREQKIAVFADGQLALDAKNAGAELIVSGAEIPKLASDKQKLKELLAYESVAQPSLMAVVGKHLGQVLGTRGKLPKPITGAVSDAIARARRVVKIKSKGRYLPVAQCAIGTEAMDAGALAENAEAVLEAVKNKVGEQSIKSVYIKLTMGKPVKVE